MKREIRDLLHNLVDDSETIPEPEVKVSAASRRKVDAIIEKMDQEKADAQAMPKPVYNKPPKRRRPPVNPPEPVSHFTEEPSQNPVVRMHDRLLEDALPSPDPEKKPVQKSESKSKSKKKKNTAESSKPKKEFRIEIKEELPPDIPRDTTVADRLKQEQLEAVLAATPPKTPEQLRKEKVRKHAAEIKKQMKENKNKKPVPEPVQEAPEPEEVIPEWEDELSEFSQNAEKENSAQLRFLKEKENSEIPTLSNIPDIPEHSGEDTALVKMSQELGEETPKPKKKKKKKKKKPDAKKSENKSEEKIPEDKKPEKKKSSGKLSAFFGNLFGQKSDASEEKSEDQDKKNQQKNIYQPPEKTTEVLISPDSAQNTEKKHDLSFAENTKKDTLAVTGTKKNKKTIVSRKKI